jgi:endonuclease YncB( thermonuclease family)
MRKLTLLGLTILFLIFTGRTFVNLYRANMVEYEVVSRTTYIVDGDTFDITDGSRIRLADVSCPEYDEYGGNTATNTISELIYGKTVYLDIDNLYRTGPYGRLICLVYVDFNSTHFLNVNKAMVILGQATVTDYDNQWNPYTWSLFVEKMSFQTIITLLGISSVSSLVVVIILYYVGSRLWADSKGWRKGITDQAKKWEII